MARKRVPREPDVEIGAVAHAKKVRFKRKPRVETKTRAQVEVDPALRDEVPIEAEGGSQADRKNLPEEVEPEVTYRNVSVGWRAGARVKLDDERDND